MPKKFPIDGGLPEVFHSSEYPSKRIHALRSRGMVRKIAPRLYTSNIDDSVDAIVRRHLWRVAALLYPGAVISERTAVEMRVADDGSLFVISGKKRPVSVGGITIRPGKGAPPQASDMPFIGGLYLASPARIILENVAASRVRSGVARRLSGIELEEYLDGIIKERGEAALLKLRDAMRELAPRINLRKEFDTVNKLIAALLRTRAGRLESKAGMARAAGFPFDARRAELFAGLFNELESAAPVTRPGQPSVILAFFEAYFSNFIEGTEFAVDEAEKIIFKKIMPENRPEDAHDIAGTFDIVSNDSEMKKTPGSFDDFMDILKSRHKILMAGRPDKNPGVIKDRVNQAGAVVFVKPDLALGTLKQGFDIYQKLTTPFARAVFMMFLVAEVHPFNDGNGRVGRVMMNAELVSAGEQRIIIPTIYRNNYIAALKALSNSGKAVPIVRVLDFAQKYTASVNWGSFDAAMDILTKTKAFADPNVADENGERLMLPSRVIG